MPESVPSGPSCSVIVLTYNSRQCIQACLDSVLAQDYPCFEAVVVDNDSADGTAAFVEATYPGVRLVRAKRNGGYGAGNNLGARHAAGEVLVFLNPDTVAEAGWLCNLVNTMVREGRKLATSKIVLLADPERLNTSGNIIHFLGLSYCRGWKEPRSSYSRPELVQGISGASFAVTRDLYERIGGFDETLFMYHDDVDLSLRALLAGERCLYVPDAVVRHAYHLDPTPRKWQWVEAHRYAVLLKVFKPATLAVLLPGLLAVDALTLVYLAARGPRFALAKLASYLWVARHWAALLRQRRSTQRTRKFSDRTVLSLLTDRIPYAQVAPRGLSHLATWLVDPLFAAYRGLTLALVRW